MEWVQGARLERSGGAKFIAKACHLGRLRILVWVDVLDWVRIILMFCLLPTNCFHRLFVWMRLSVFLFVCLFNGLYAQCYGTKFFWKMWIVISWFVFVYNYIFLGIIFNFYYCLISFFLSSFFFPWENGERHVLGCFP